MHTSSRLCAQDFHYRRQLAGGPRALDFAAFCPDYHPQDRVGVVSVALEDGVLHTSYALLALTTAFYNALRASGKPFFDYPQHFAFVGMENGNEAGDDGGHGGAGVGAGLSLLPENTPHLWDAWSWLDVWPEAKWVTAPATSAGMLRRVFDYQINRLFWPCSLQAVEQPDALPGYLWKMLRTSVKSIYLYGQGGAAWAGLAGECVEIRGDAAAQELVRESVERLPATLISGPLETVQLLERVNVQAFFDVMAGKLIDRLVRS